MICYIFLWQVWLAHSCLPHFREDPLDSSKAAKFKLYSQDFPEVRKIEYLHFTHAVKIGLI